MNLPGLYLKQPFVDGKRLLAKFPSAVKALLILTVYFGLATKNHAQRSWDYSWGYSSTMQYYSNKAALKKKGQNTDSLKNAKREKYVMFPHAGKTTFDRQEEKLSDFKIWQITVEALKEVDWQKLGYDNVYKQRDSATNKLSSQIREAINYHDSVLAAKKLAVNDLAITWALGLAMCEQIIAGKNPDSSFRTHVRICENHLKENGIVDKTNYEKARDQIRLIDLGIRPVLQYKNVSTADQNSSSKAREAIQKFIENFATRN